jgi:hypothetical protein
MANGDNFTVVADDGVNAHPGFDESATALAAQMARESFLRGFVEEEAIGCAATFLAAASFEQINDVGRNGALLEPSGRVRGKAHFTPPVPVALARPSSNAVRGRKPSAVTMPQLLALVGLRQ